MSKGKSGNKYGAKLGYVFRDKDGCWNLINATREELRFIDTASLLIYSSLLLLYDVSSYRARSSQVAAHHIRAEL